MAIIIDPDAPAGPVTDPGPFLTEADRLYARLEPVAYADEANGYPLRELAAALTGPREVIDLIVRDTVDEDGNPVIGWGPALHPRLIPSEGQLLEWLAAFVGIEFPASALTVEEKRARIEAAAGYWRGSRQAVIDEVARTLTGTKDVRFIERVGYNAYHASIVTAPSETPDPAATLRAALAQKPAGMKFEVIQAATPIIDEASLTIDGASATATIDGAVLGDV